MTKKSKSSNNALRGTRGRRRRKKVVIKDNAGKTIGEISWSEKSSGLCMDKPGRGNHYPGATVCREDGSPAYTCSGPLFQRGTRDGGYNRLEYLERISERCDYDPLTYMTKRGL